MSGAAATESPFPPEGLACVVMSFRSEPGVVAAVRSLLDQEPPPAELVVVNTGGGEVETELAAAGLGDLPLVNEERPGYAGRARNLGIRATSARWVAFLAADCLAEPGWVAWRLARHRAGAAGVASPVTNAYPGRAPAEAAQLLMYWTRLPETPPKWRALFGASYERDVFRRYGLFREDLAAGEDVEMNSRLFEGEAFAWAPEVRTAHRHPLRVADLLRDQFVRGRRMVRATDATHGIDERRERLRATARDLHRGARALGWMAPEARRQAARGVPLLVAAAAARAAGVATTRPPTAQAIAPSRPRRRRLIGLVPFRDEMRFLPGLIPNVVPHLDGIVALDDGSTDGSREYLERMPELLEMLTVPGSDPHVWDEAATRRRLVEAGWRHGADWLFAIDADERVERDFRERAEAEFDRADREGHSGYFVHVRELWGSAERVRTDGWFGVKKKASLFRSRLDHSFDDRNLHGHWAPLNDHPDGEFPQSDVIVYHLRMLHRSDRERRRARYEALDPDRRWQDFGYDYMTDENGLELSPLPPGREFLPRETPPELL